MNYKEYQQIIHTFFIARYYTIRVHKGHNNEIVWTKKVNVLLTLDQNIKLLQNQKKGWNYYVFLTLYILSFVLFIDDLIIPSSWPLKTIITFISIFIQ